MSYSPYVLRTAWLKRLAATPGDVLEAEAVFAEMLRTFKSEGASGQVFLIDVLREAARSSDRALSLLSSLLESDASYDANEGDPYGGAYLISVRGAAAEALAELGPRAFPELEKHLGHSSLYAREAAAGALERMPEQALAAVGALLALARTPDATVRATAVRALVKAASIDPATMVRLEGLLDAPSPADRLGGVLAFDALPLERRIARLPRLIDLLDDPSFEIKEFVLNRLYVVDIPSEMKEAARAPAEQYLTSPVSSLARQAQNLIDSLDRARRRDGTSSPV